MTEFTRREKTLIGVIVFLLLIVTYLSFEIYFPVTSTSVITKDSDIKPPSLEESIKDANVIFTCNNEIKGNRLKCQVDNIIYHEDAHEFPFKVGDIYPELNKKIKPDVRYGDAQLVFLSEESKTPFRNASIFDGEVKKISIIDGELKVTNLDLESFIREVEKIKNESYMDRE